MRHQSGTREAADGQRARHPVFRNKEEAFAKSIEATAQRETPRCIEAGAEVKFDAALQLYLESGAASETWPG